MLATLGRDLRVSTNARGGTNESSGASPPTALGVVALAAGVIPGSPEDRSGVQGTCDAGGPDELALKADSPPAVKRLSTERTKQMYAAHRQTQEKLEAKREETATSGCTFSPRLSSKQKSTTGEEVPAHDRLYQESLKQRTKMQQKMEQQCTEYSFCPTLPTANSRLAAKPTALSAAAGHQRAEAKSKVTAEMMYRDCTFSPNTTMTKTFNATVMAKKKGEQASLVDRLYTSPKEQLARTKRREAEQASNELCECTFHPATRGSKKSGGKWDRDEPGRVHERLHSIHCEVQMKQETKRKEFVSKELSECSFSPILLAAPKKTTDSTGGVNGGGDSREENVPFYERLYKRRDKVEDRGGIDLECTFQPRLTSRCPEPIRIKLAADGHDERGTRRLENMYNAGREFQAERSRSPRNYTAVKLEKDEQGEMSLCTFKPDLSATASSPFKVEKRGKAIFETLYAAREMTTSADCARQEAMKACTFSPELQSCKTRLGRSMSPRRGKGEVFEELFTDAKLQTRARAQSAEDLQASECPFKPKMTAKMRTSRTPRRMPDSEIFPTEDGFPLPRPPSASQVEGRKEESTPLEETSPQIEATLEEEATSQNDVTVEEEGTPQSEATADEEGTPENESTVEKEGITQSESTVEEEGTQSKATAEEEGTPQNEATLAEEEGITQNKAIAAKEDTPQNEAVVEKEDTPENETIPAEGGIPQNEATVEKEGTHQKKGKNQKKGKSKKKDAR